MTETRTPYELVWHMTGVVGAAGPASTLLATVTATATGAFSYAPGADWKSLEDYYKHWLASRYERHGPGRCIEQGS